MNKVDRDTWKRVISGEKKVDIDTKKIIDSPHIVSNEEMINSMTSFIQKIIDGKAQDKKYDNGLSCASYATSTSDKFKSEAQKFVAWRDSVWTLGYAILDKAVKDEKYVDTWVSCIPTQEELQAVLPILEW